MTIRVAITGVSGEVGLGAIRGLLVREPADEPIWILGLDWSEDCAARHFVDRYIRVPPVADSHYVDVLIRHLQDNAIDLLLPGIDSEIIVLSRARERLAQAGIHVVLAPQELVEAADDKLATPAFLAARGLAAPPTCDADAPQDLGFPLVAKPRRGQASRGVMILSDASALAEFRKAKRSGYCLQQHVGGPEITAAFLYDSEGVMRDAMAMERTLDGGRTIRGTVASSGDIVSFMEKFGARVRGVGAVNAQLRWHPSSGPLIFEVNARLSGSTGMRVAIGFNDPLRLVRHFARGVSIERADVRSATVYRYSTELVVPR